MHLYPGVRLHIVDSCTIKISYGARGSLLFKELLPDEHAWVCSLTHSSVKQKTELCDENPDLFARVQPLSKALYTHGFARKTPIFRKGTLHAHTSVESITLNARGLDGPAVISRRKAAVVAVRGISRTSFHALTALASAGIENFVLDDPGPVETLDMSAEPFIVKGAATREAAVSHAFKHNWPNVRIRSTDTPVDAVLLAGAYGTDLYHAAHLQAGNIPHMTAVESASSTRVGPFIIPALTGCLNCVHVATAEHGVNDDVATFCSPDTHEVPAAASTVSAAMAGAFIAGQMLQYIDGFIPFTSSRIVFFDSFGQLPTSVLWSADSTCLCQAEKTTISENFENQCAAV
ncbi:hypothetical protein [Timonella sp. A28]|uniref:hypothetical protein n=1 Tax=Timonella sp. A28 TaxID=3442640 RepID=UPI003EB9E941